MSFWSRVTTSGRPARTHAAPRFVWRLPVWLAVSAAVLAATSTVVAQDARRPDSAASTFPNPSVARTIATGLVVPDATVRAGVQSRIGMAWDCLQPHQAPHVSATAAKGLVVLKKGKGAACGRPSVDVTYIYYTSSPGFKGTDKVYVMSLVTGGLINSLMTIAVK